MDSDTDRPVAGLNLEEVLNNYNTSNYLTVGQLIRRMRNCLDAHLGQIVCDKDGVVDWCIVLVEMPLMRFEECWPLLTESLAELP